MAEQGYDYEGGEAPELDLSDPGLVDVADQLAQTIADEAQQRFEAARAGQDPGVVAARIQEQMADHTDHGIAADLAAEFPELQNEERAGFLVATAAQVAGRMGRESSMSLVRDVQEAINAGARTVEAIAQRVGQRDFLQAISRPDEGMGSRVLPFAPSVL